MGRKRKKKRTDFRKVALIAAVVVIAVGAAVYVGTSRYYQKHFLPQTAINGLNCAGLTVEQVKDKIQTRVLEYSLTIHERGGASETLTGEQIGLTYVDDGSVEKLMEEQNAYSWPKALRERSNFSVEAASSYDRAQVTVLLDALNCFQESNITAPADAYIQDNGTAYEIVPEVEGNLLNRENTEAAVNEAIGSGTLEVNLEELGLYERPQILSTDEALNNEVNQLNTLTAANITYDFTDRTYVVDRGLIQSWLYKDEQGNYALDEAQAAAWVRQMAYETDTFGLAHDFKTTLGPTIHLQAGGDYGWVINKDQTTAALLEAIRGGVVETREPVYLYRGKDRSVNDIGGTYVEVCISQQKMWCYKDGVLVAETPVVTGDNATGYNTPAGSVWAVDGKKRDFDFKLYPVHVTFWLPFNGNVGIHDASWRGNYGGNIYLTNGSHGCVNTPYDAAEKIFNAIEIGDPVVVYYSLDDVVGPQPTQENSI